MTKKIMGIFLLLGLFSLISPEAHGTEEAPVFQKLESMENLVYGGVRSGGLIARLIDLEKTLFGRELPGTVAERQTALMNFVEKGSEAQPSLFFKLAVAEWITEQNTDPQMSIVHRVAALERKLEGQSMSEGPVAMRLERLLGILVTEPVKWRAASLPQGTVVRVALTETLSPSSVSVGQKVLGTLAQDMVVGTDLIAPKGSTVEGTVSKVSKPRSFGRPGEVTFAFDRLLPPSLTPVPLTVSDVSVKAAEAESAQIAAAGGSLVGAILLGPVGLAGGFLVRGDVKEIPAGTIFHLEAGEGASPLAYSVPEGLWSLIKPDKETPSPEDEKTSESELDSL